MHTCCPKWVAPNLLTAVGFAHAIAAYVLLLTHSPGLDGEAPSWVYFACAAMLFVYQTMDGMDGKQARRVRAGSPLGEVVDHGADAIAGCAYGLFICEAFGITWGGAGLGLGRAPAVFIIAYSRVSFLIDSVTATYTGRLPVAPVDAQELQMAVQGALLWNATFGPGLWRGLVDVAPLTRAFGLGGSDRWLIPVGVLVVGWGSVVGLCARVATVAAALRGPPSPHLPEYASTGPAPLYLRMVAYEAVLTCCVAACHNLPVCHAVTTIAFGDAMVRLMHLRVSDPRFAPLASPWLGALAVASALLPEGGEGGAWGDAALSAPAVATVGVGLVAAGVVAYVLLFSSLVAQITGCLNLPRNPFVISREKYA